MSMLHDTNKRLIKVSDIYPDYADLKKGDYVIRLQLRHEDAVLLDKMKEIPVVVERKLKEAVTVPVYATNRDAVKGGKAVKERALHPGEYDTITDQLRMQSQLCYSSKTAISPCIVPCLALLCSMCPCPALPCPVLSCPALPCPALPCPALPCPALPCPALPCPALPCPALCHTVLRPAERSMPCCARLCWPVASAEAHPTTQGKQACSFTTRFAAHLQKCCARCFLSCYSVTMHTMCVALPAGERVAYFLGPVPQDKLPKDAAPGTCLAGSLKLGLLQGSKEHAPGAFPIFYRLPPLILTVPGCFLLHFASSCLRSSALSFSFGLFPCLSILLLLFMPLYFFLPVLPA